MLQAQELGYTKYTGMFTRGEYLRRGGRCMYVLAMNSPAGKRLYGRGIRRENREHRPWFVLAVHVSLDGRGRKGKNGAKLLPRFAPQRARKSTPECQKRGSTVMSCHVIPFPFLLFGSLRMQRYDVYTESSLLDT